MWKYTQKIRQSKCPEWSISCPWSLQAGSPSSHTHAHLWSLFASIVAVSYFPTFSGKAAQGATHCWGNDVSKSNSVTSVFSNRVSSPSNSFSEQMSFQLHVYIVLSPWKAELTRKTTTRSCLDYVTVLKPRRRHRKSWRNGTKACCSCL